MHLKHTFNVTVFFISIGILLAQSVSAQTSLPEYDGMVIFGNSLSDNGNAHQMVCGTSDCGPNLFTDGKNTVEYLAEYFAHPNPPFEVAPARNYLNTDTMGYSFNIFKPEGTNFAIGGTVVPVERQVGRYLAAVNNQASNQSLYVFFLGANWVNYSVQEEIEGEPCSTEDPNVCPGRHKGMLKLSQYLHELEWSMGDLIDAGAQHFLVINTNTFSTTPTAREYFPDYLAEINAYAMNYNHELYRQTGNLAAVHDVEIQYFDLYSLHEHITNSPEYYQLSNVDDPCGIFNTSTQSFGYAAPCSEETISEYLYYDGVHWTSAVHKIIAEFIFMEALGIAPPKPEIVSKTVTFEDGNADFVVEVTEDASAVNIQFNFSESPAQEISDNQWALQLSDVAPGFYPYSVVLKNEQGVTNRSYSDFIYFCEEKTLDQFVASGQVNFNPGSRWFWFSTPGEYVIASTGLKVGDEGDGNELLRLVPVFGVWEFCPDYS